MAGSFPFKHSLHKLFPMLKKEDITDEFVTDLILQESEALKDRAERLGVLSYLKPAQMARTATPDTRFLKNIVDRTVGYNKHLERKESGETSAPPSSSSSRSNRHRRERSPDRRRSKHDNRKKRAHSSSSSDSDEGSPRPASKKIMKGRGSFTTKSYALSPPPSPPPGPQPLRSNSPTLPHQDPKNEKYLSERMLPVPLAEERVSTKATEIISLDSSSDSEQERHRKHKHKHKKHKDKKKHKKSKKDKKHKKSKSRHDSSSNNRKKPIEID